MNGWMGGNKCMKRPAPYRNAAPESHIIITVTVTAAVFPNPSPSPPSKNAAAPHVSPTNTIRCIPLPQCPRSADDTRSPSPNSTYFRAQSYIGSRAERSLRAMGFSCCMRMMCLSLFHFLIAQYAQPACSEFLFERLDFRAVRVAAEIGLLEVADC